MRKVFNICVLLILIFTTTIRAGVLQVTNGQSVKIDSISADIWLDSPDEVVIVSYCGKTKISLSQRSGFLLDYVWGRLYQFHLISINGDSIKIYFSTEKLDVEEGRVKFGNGWYRAEHREFWNDKTFFYPKHFVQFVQIEVEPGDEIARQHDSGSGQVILKYLAQKDREIVLFLLFKDREPWGHGHSTSYQQEFSFSLKVGEQVIIGAPLPITRDRARGLKLIIELKELKSRARAILEVKEG